MREQAFGIIASGQNGDVAVDIDDAAIAAAAAIAANGDAGRAERAGRGLDGKAARPAAAADRLRINAARPVAGGRYKGVDQGVDAADLDRPLAQVDVDIAALAARIAGAAQGNAREQADRGRRTAIAAAAADALHEHAMRIVAGRRQISGHVGGHEAAVAAGRAVAADAQQ